MKKIILFSLILSSMSYAQNISLKCFAKDRYAIDMDATIPPLDIETDEGINFIRIIKNGELVFESTMPYELSESRNFETRLEAQLIEFATYPEREKARVQTFNGYLVNLDFGRNYFCTKKHFL